MRLLLFHPGVLKIDCDQCKQFIHDLETGKLKTFRAGPDREEKPCLRPANLPPPCRDCPKEELGFAISEKNWKTIGIHQEVQTTFGRCLSKRMRNDPLLMRNLSIIDGIWKRFEREQAAVELAHQVALLYK